MSVHDAQPGDIFVDENDKLWRVTGRWDEPVVCVEAVESSDTLCIKTKKQGGISGVMWRGFAFLHRPKPKPNHHSLGGINWK